MDIHIAVLGTGAIGSSIGADLARAGYNVILIDQWPAHVEAMKAHGLHIAIRGGEELHTPVQAFHLCEVSAMRPELDIVFLAPKSYDTCWMVEFIKPYLKPEGILVSVQNGVNDEWIAPMIGYHRDIPCSFELSAGISEPGKVRRRTDHVNTKFVVGEMHGRITTRLQKVAQILSSVGKTVESTNIWGAKWSKLVLNTMACLDVITGVPDAELIERPETLEICTKVAQETATVGAALGYSLEPILGLTAEDFSGFTDEVFKRLMLKLFSDVGKEAQSMSLRDVLRGRRTEVDYLNGLVVKKGQEVRVPTPLNAVVTSLVGQIERGALKLDISNLKLLEQAAHR